METRTESTREKGRMGGKERKGYGGQIVGLELENDSFAHLRSKEISVSLTIK